MFVRNGRLNFFVISSVVSTLSSHEDTPEISIRSKVILCHTHNCKPSKSGLCLTCDPFEQHVLMTLIPPPAEPPPPPPPLPRPCTPASCRGVRKLCIRCLSLSGIVDVHSFQVCLSAVCLVWRLYCWLSKRRLDQLRFVDNSY